MFVDVLQECGSLSADFEGFFVTADPTVVKQLMNSKEHTATRSKLYQVCLLNCLCLLYPYHDVICSYLAGCFLPWTAC